jgi:hypothetical protein
MLMDTCASMPQGAQRDMGLHPYAEAFVWQGFAVLVRHRQRGAGGCYRS